MIILHCMRERNINLMLIYTVAQSELRVIYLPTRLERMTAQQILMQSGMMKGSTHQPSTVPRPAVPLVRE